MNITPIVRGFCFFYFYISMALASIDGFKNMINDFKLTRKHLFIFLLFPITFFVELLLYTIYQTYNHISKH